MTSTAPLPETPRVHVTVPRPADRTARAGRVTAVAGVLGAASGLLLAAWPVEVSPERFSYPLGSTSHLAFQLFFAAQHVALVAGLVALARLARPTTGRATRAGLGLAVAGMVVLTVTEVVVGFAGREVAGDSGSAAAFGAAYGVATLALGVGLTVAGVGLARRPVLPGRWRWVVLALGLWVFVPMLPALTGPMVAGRLAIAGWMLLFAALGAGLRAAASRAS